MFLVNRGLYLSTIQLVMCMAIFKISTLRKLCSWQRRVKLNKLRTAPFYNAMSSIES
jgi:hypothetical protein